MAEKTWIQLIHELHSSDVKRAILACEKINAVADGSHVPELYALLNDENTIVRYAAASPLARLEGIRALPALFQAMTLSTQDVDNDDLLVSPVARLIEANQEVAMPILLEMVACPSNDIRSLSAWALRFVASQISSLPLFELIENDVNLGVRSAATASLGSYKGYPEVLDKLISLLHDPSLHIKVAAIAALADLGDKKTIGPLLELQEGSSETIRLSIRFALERLK